MSNVIRNAIGHDKGNSLSPEPCVLIPTNDLTLHACSVSRGRVAMRGGEAA